MQATIALALKDLKLLVRDKAGFFFTIFFPILYAIFFGLIFAGGGGDGSSSAPSGIPILVVDEDDSDGSAEFIRELDESALRVERVASRDEAAARVRNGRSSAYLVIPAKFGENSNNLFYGETPTIEIGVDPARAATSGMIQGLVTEIAFRGMQEMFTNPAVARERIRAAAADVAGAADMPATQRTILSTFLTALDMFLQNVPELVGPNGGGDGDGDGGDGDGGDGNGASAGWQPMKIAMTDVAREKADSSGRITPKNSFEISFPQAILWGIMGCAAGFGISMVSERVHGTLIRLRMAPISRREILCGKAIACFAATSMIAIVLLTFGAIVFKIRPDSIGLLALAIVATSTCFVGVMMLLSVIGKTEAAAGGIGWAILLVFAMIGGGMIPLFVMPPWLISVSNLSPVKWAILSLEGAIWRQFTFADMMLPVAILVAVGAVCFAVGATVFQRTEA